MACAGCARRRAKIKRAWESAKARVGLGEAPQQQSQPTSNDPAAGNAVNREGRVTRVVRVK